MAVQAQYQYQSNLFLLLRGENTDGGKMVPKVPNAPPQPQIIEPSTATAAALLPALNRRKRTREAAASKATMQTQGNGNGNGNGIGIGSAAAALQPQFSMVSTGLRLAFGEQSSINRRRENQSSNQIRSFLPDEITRLLAHQRDDLDRFLSAQWEELRRALAERQRLNEQTLLRAAEAAAAKTMREKEAEAEESARRNVELENRVTRLRAESMAWQTKALAEQATAAALKHQLQQTVAAAAAAAVAPADPATGDGRGEPADVPDGESAHIDPGRLEPTRPSSPAEPQRPSALCRACQARHVSVVLLPCRHLCLCADCDATRSMERAVCPVCCCSTTGSVPVFLS